MSPEVWTKHVQGFIYLGGTALKVVSQILQTQSFVCCPCVLVSLCCQGMKVLYLGRASRDRAAGREVQTHLNIPFSLALAMIPYVHCADHTCSISSSEENEHHTISSVFACTDVWITLVLYIIFKLACLCIQTYKMFEHKNLISLTLKALHIH